MTALLAGADVIGLSSLEAQVLLVQNLCSMTEVLLGVL